ncbi:DUF1622 domain-containing protein [Szabonella alba]|uniref:DUF1622 domain-containing protein n=1 Tax=Szabonella alba TaxID=2804194 RepID=A0A8K0Y285_9RHOB|nr:DUF1622 domain-containing protein [Szabonella alba]MBL4918917.1 DUF1622 domain-containing protein [Szabonella alba]
MGAEQRQTYLEIIAQLLEFCGVLAILAGIVLAIWEALRHALRQRDGSLIFDLFRTRLARSILIGVEFLIAADLIGTVTVDPTLQNLGELAIIVVIRTFLSFTLEVEIAGRWPWQRHRDRPSEG